MQGNVLCGHGRPLAGVAGALVLLLLNACAGTPPAAEALFAPVQGATTTGRAVFEEEKEGVRVVAHFAGLGPVAHGFHIHEKGDCGANGVGNGGSLTMPKTDAYGNAALDAVLPGLTLQGEKGIVGKGVTVRTAPGVPMACGVIVKR